MRLFASSRRPMLSLIGALMLLLAGCVTTPPGGTEPSPVSFESLDQGDQSDVEEEGERTIADQESWRSFWAEHQEAMGRSSETPPEVDFTTHFVLAVYAGTQGTGGHGIEVVNISMLGGVYIAQAVHHVPGEDCLTTQALTHPYHIVNVERGDDDDGDDAPEVTVDIESQTYRC